MQETPPPLRLTQTALTLLAGAAVAAVLWLAGARDLIWLGFLAVAFAWPTTAAISDRRTKRPAPAHGTATAVVPDELPDGRYVLDPWRSRVRFSVRKLGALRVQGRFTQVAGSITVDPRGARVVAFVGAGSFRTSNGRRDEHVMGPTFLDASHHRSLRFEGSVAGRNGTTVAGTLTVRGVEAPVTFLLREANWSSRERQLCVVAETVVRRSSFGVTAYRWLAGDEILVTVEGCLVLSDDR